MNFIQATKIWNDTQKKDHNKAYCVPRKGTEPYFEVIKIMEEYKIKPKYTTASNTLKAVLARNKAVKEVKPVKEVKQVKPINLLDLKPDALNIIGGFVEKDNKKRLEQEQIKIKEINALNKKKWAKQLRDAKKKSYFDVDGMPDITPESYNDNTFRKHLLNMIDILKLSMDNEYEIKYFKIAILNNINWYFRAKRTFDYKINYEKVVKIVFDVFKKKYQIKYEQYIPADESNKNPLASLQWDDLYMKMYNDK